MQRLNWRPIADVPADLRRALIFDPTAWYAHSSTDVSDNRICLADRDGDDWWADDEQGGRWNPEPTHFALVHAPDGFDEVVSIAAANAAVADREANKRAIKDRAASAHAVELAEANARADEARRLAEAFTKHFAERGSTPLPDRT